MFYRAKEQFIKSQGFTLIELLVVISIIGILSSFAVVSLNSARQKARDALRKGDMAQLRTAISLYYDDDVRYPICGSWDDDDVDFGATSVCYNSTLSTALTSGTKPYMGVTPKDPKNSENKTAAEGGSDTFIYRYVSKDDGSEYAITYSLEDGGLQVMRGW